MTDADPKPKPAEEKRTEPGQHDPNFSQGQGAVGVVCHLHAGEIEQDGPGTVEESLSHSSQFLYRGLF